MDPALTREILARRDAAARIAGLAGAKALAYFHDRGRLQVSHKAAQDRVSEADREVERLIRDEVARAFPADSFLGEEHGATRGESPFVWVVDPIDGTTPFLSGLPGWCVSIAVAHAGEPVVGVIEVPVTAETYVGASGQGATLNGEPLKLDPARSVSDGLFAFGGSLRCDAGRTGRFITRMMQGGGVAYHNGSGALMLAYVASGRLVGYYDELIMPWDCFAGLVLVAEAGGQTRFGRLEETGNGAPMLVGVAGVFAEADGWLAELK